MAKIKTSIRRVHPASIANLFVRGILADVGQQLGGFSHEEWTSTLEFFNNRCAYTGKALSPANLDRDHAVPVNRFHAGLHMHGNLVPACREANNEKGALTYKEFLRSGKPSLAGLSADELQTNLDRLHEFQRSFTNYQTQRDRLPNLPAYCEAQYNRVKMLYETINVETNDWLVEQGVELQPSEVDVELGAFMENEEDLTQLLPAQYASLVAEFGDAPNKVFIPRLFKMLSQDDLLTKFVSRLTTKPYSARLKSAVAVLATERVKMPNAFRHYPETLTVDGATYYLSSQWNQPERGVLLAWLTDEVFHLSLIASVPAV